MKINFLLTLLLGLVLALQYALWFGDKNALDWYRLQRATAQSQQENLALQRSNEKLAAEATDLKQGGETVKSLARSQFGLIESDETFYQIIE